MRERLQKLLTYWSRSWSWCTHYSRALIRANTVIVMWGCEENVVILTLNLRRCSCSLILKLWSWIHVILIWTCLFQIHPNRRPTFFTWCHGCWMSSAYSSSWPPTSTTPLTCSSPSTSAPGCSCTTTPSPTTVHSCSRTQSAPEFGSPCFHSSSPSATGLCPTSSSGHYLAPTRSFSIFRTNWKFPDTFLKHC